MKWIYVSLGMFNFFWFFVEIKNIVNNYLINAILSFNSYMRRNANKDVANVLWNGKESTSRFVRNISLQRNGEWKLRDKSRYVYTAALQQKISTSIARALFLNVIRRKRVTKKNSRLPQAARKWTSCASGKVLGECNARKPRWIIEPTGCEQKNIRDSRGCRLPLVRNIRHFAITDCRASSGINCDE